MIFMYIVKFFFFLITFVLVFLSNSVFSENIDDKVKEFILKNPEVIIQSLQNYEKQLESKKNNENKEIIKNNYNEIFNSRNNLYDGNYSSKKVIVEFFDYNCSYCKRAHNDIKALLEKKKGFKVIYKNFPILSDFSIELAKYAIIISEIDHKKFLKFHNELLNSKGLIKKKKLLEILKKIDVDEQFLTQKLNDPIIEKKLELDINLAKKLNLRGTPAFVIGKEIIFGYINLEEMNVKLDQQ